MAYIFVVKRDTILIVRRVMTNLGRLRAPRRVEPCVGVGREGGGGVAAARRIAVERVVYAVLGEWRDRRRGRVRALERAAGGVVGYVVAAIVVMVVLLVVFAREIELERLDLLLKRVHLIVEYVDLRRELLHLERRGSRRRRSSRSSRGVESFD